MPKISNAGAVYQKPAQGCFKDIMIHPAGFKIRYGKAFKWSRKACKLSGRIFHKMLKGFTISPNNLISKPAI